MNNSVSSINFNNLFYAHRIMELGSIKLASEELGLAQSTLSEHLKQVETSLGTKLFTRGKNGLMITPDGQTLYKYTHLIFKTADRVRGIFLSKENPKKNIDVGVLPSVINSRTAKFLLPLFLDENIMVKIHQADSSYLIKSFIQQELDIFFSDYKLELPSMEGLESEYLGSVSYYLVYDPKNEKILATYESDKGTIPFVHSSIRAESRWSVEQFFAGKNIRLDVKGESDDVELIKEIIMTIPACSVLPVSLVQNELNDGTLVQLDVEAVGSSSLYASYLTNDSIDTILNAISRIKKSIKG